MLSGAADTALSGHTDTKVGHFPRAPEEISSFTVTINCNKRSFSCFNIFISSFVLGEIVTRGSRGSRARIS